MHVFQSSKVADSAHGNWHDEQQEQILGRLELMLWFAWLVQVAPVGIVCLCFSQPDVQALLRLLLQSKSWQRSRRHRIILR